MKCFYFSKVPLIIIFLNLPPASHAQIELISSLSIVLSPFFSLVFPILFLAVVLIKNLLLLSTCFAWGLCEQRLCEVNDIDQILGGLPVLLKLKSADCSIGSLYLWVPNLSYKLDLWKSKWIIYSRHVDVEYKLSTDEGSIRWTRKSHIPIKQVTSDQVNLESRSLSFFKFLQIVFK